MNLLYKPIYDIIGRVKYVFGPRDASNIRGRELTRVRGFAMNTLYPFPLNDNTPVKTCTGPCGRVLPATPEFWHRDKTKRDGLVIRCKECRSASRRKEPHAPKTHKQCTGMCKRTLPATFEFFYHKKPAKDGLTSRCKECMSEKQKSYSYNGPSEGSMKRCLGPCGQEYPATAEYFHRVKSGKYGLRGKCKSFALGHAPKFIIIPAPEGYKHCTGPCGQVLPATTEYFFKVKSGTYGLRGMCKACALGHPIKKPVPEGYKRCTGLCGQEYPATKKYFSRLKTGKYGLEGQCKKCKSKKAKAYNSQPDVKTRRYVYGQSYYQKHREDMRAYHKEYLSRPGVQQHKNASTRNYRALKRSIGGTHTPAQIQDQLKRQKYRCYYAACGHAKFKKINGQYQYHVEHTFPISRVAGTDIPANSIDYLVLSCPFCNDSKGNKFPWEWPQGGRLL